MEIEIPHRLATLGHPQRLALFRLLMRRYPDQVPATELAEALGVKPNTLSVYVGALMGAGLITRERVGTSLRYGIDMETTGATFDYLLQDCCRGRPELCAPPQEAGPSGAERPSVLFLCTGNSARSIFAEAILTAEAGERVSVFSAGTRPRAEPHPLALEVLRRQGHGMSGLSSKGLTDLPDGAGFDLVITVCNGAANEELPAWNGQPVCAHWGIPDPAAVTGPGEARRQAFQQTYERIKDRIRALAALPVATLGRADLQRAVDGIAADRKGQLS